MDKIKSFEDACQVLGISAEVPVVGALPEKHQKALVAHYKLIIIAQALNAGWEPDYTEGNWKYYPWFEIDANEQHKEGVGFSYSGYDSWVTTTSVGSRLCFKSRELALYAAKQFEDLYKEYFLIQN